MPGSTTVYNLPYPLENETADPRLDLLALAEATETALGAVEDAIPAMPDVPVLSVNGETGAVTLSAADVGAETPTGAQAKADTAETNAKTYADTKDAEHLAEEATQAHLAQNIGLEDVDGLLDAEDVEGAIAELAATGYKIVIPETATTEEVAFIELAIPTGYRKLKLFLRNLKSVDTSSHNAYIGFNGDVGSNYSYEYSYDTSGGGSSGSTTGILLARQVSNINHRSVFIDIENDPALDKDVYGFFNGRRDSVSERGHLNGAWGNTSDEISSIKISINGATISSGAKVEVWGLK